MLLGIILAVLLANIAAFGQECDALRKDVVRLHIMANSDSEADQSLKLKVRDRILAEVGGVFAVPQSQSAAKATAVEHLPAIQAAAERELRANGSNAPVKAEVCNMYFTTRDYAEISLPAGNYDAVRVTIGTGTGKNWWCVMYPPMCVAGAMPEDSVPMEEIEHLNDAPLFVPKLAIVELFESFRR